VKRLIPFFHIALFSAAIAVLLPACKKDDPDLPADNCYISANIDGRDYRWELSESNCTFTSQKLSVGDIASDEAQLTIDPVDGTGDYYSIDPDVDMTIFLTTGPAAQIFVGDVEISVTTLSASEATGTFEGIFTDIGGTIYQVANGKFRAVF
jgi:hypothetical protein